MHKPVTPAQKMRLENRLIVIFWGLAAAVMALYIPEFDFGFDGVVLWFFYSLLLLGIIGVARWAVRLSLGTGTDS